MTKEMVLTQDEAAFLADAGKGLLQAYRSIKGAPPLPLTDLPQGQTALVVIDPLEGFTRKGPLQSARIARIIPSIRRLMEWFAYHGMPVLVLADSHPENSQEFDAYPQHCIVGTEECDVVSELQEIGHYHLISKNSTNGYLEEDFQQFLAQNPQITHWVVTMDCTDICVWQFATTLKAHFNRLNRPSEIIVPVDGVETFHTQPDPDSDYPGHHGDLFHVMALASMKLGGIRIVSRLD